jgi:hypothetical protein
MKKKILWMSFVLMALFCAPTQTQAQGFLGKLSKGLDKASKILDAASDKPQEGSQQLSGQTVKQNNGVSIANPISAAMEVELVKAIGRSTSENFGNVELVLRIKVKAAENSIALGGSWGQGKTQAFDADGNVYKMDKPSVSDRYDVTEGLPIKITCNPFLKVRKTEKLAVVKMVAKCGDASGEITMKDVPIEWDPTDE